RDLRLHDHAALHFASGSKNIAVVFVFDTNILKHLKDKTDKRVFFIYESLNELNQELQKKGSRLIIRHGDPCHEIPLVAKELSAQGVYVCHDYDPYSKTRDQKVKKSLES